jgi:hypothetical protein
MSETTRAAQLFHLEHTDTVLIRARKRADGGFSPAKGGQHVFKCNTRHTLRQRCDIVTRALTIMHHDANASPALIVVAIEQKGEWEVLGAICERGDWPTFAPRDELRKTNAYNEAVLIAAEHLDRIVTILQEDFDRVLLTDGVDITVHSS